MASARDDWLGGVPKSGTAVPNRVFVGGISGNTKEDDLTNLFSKFGIVKSTKIIVDKAGISKGYGFVTFETEEEAQKVLKEVECVTLKDRKLNIAPAVKKQPYHRSVIESSSVSSPSLVWGASAPPYSAGPFHARDSLYYPQASWPVMWPPQFYLQQQCNYPQAAAQAAGYHQYVYSIAADYPLQTMGAFSSSDFSENSSAENESVKPRPKASTPHPPDADRRPPAPKRPASSPDPLPQFHGGPPVFAKTVNGVTVMAYPSPFLMGSPALVQVRSDPDSDSLLTELGFPLGALTPPPTPLSCEFSGDRKN